MMDKETIPVTIDIGGFVMKLPKIPRKDEQIYRDAKKLLMHYLDHYALKYNRRSYQEVLIITAYQLAAILSEIQLSQDDASNSLSLEIQKLLQAD